MDVFRETTFTWSFRVCSGGDIEGPRSGHVDVINDELCSRHINLIGGKGSRDICRQPPDINTWLDTTGSESAVVKDPFDLYISGVAINRRDFAIDLYIGSNGLRPYSRISGPWADGKLDNRIHVPARRVFNMKLVFLDESPPPGQLLVHLLCVFSR